MLCLYLPGSSHCLVVVLAHWRAGAVCDWQERSNQSVLFYQSTKRGEPEERGQWGAVWCLSVFILCFKLVLPLRRLRAEGLESCLVGKDLGVLAGCT